MQLPLRLPWENAQDRWSSIISPAVNSPIVQGHLIPSQALVNGVTVINHRLGRQMQGWALVDQDAAASIYRSAALNDLTLTLTSTAVCNIALWVF